MREKVKSSEIVRALHSAITGRANLKPDVEALIVEELRRRQKLLDPEKFSDKKVKIR